MKTAQQELILASNEKIVTWSYSFGRLLMANLQATSAKLALRPKHRLNTWIHDDLATKTSCYSLCFIENTTSREMGPPACST